MTKQGQTALIIGGAIAAAVIGFVIFKRRQAASANAAPAVTAGYVPAYADPNAAFLSNLLQGGQPAPSTGQPSTTGTGSGQGGTGGSGSAAGSPQVGTATMRPTTVATGQPFNETASGGAGSGTPATGYSGLIGIAPGTVG